MNRPKIKYYIFVPVQLLRKIVFPISLIYALVVIVRNFLYDVGIFKSRSFATPTICIGNLSLGGTGKTPMAEFLVSELQKDCRMAFLSRGYRRKTKGFVLATINSEVEELGDEPYQIHSKFPDIAVAVDADRRNGIAVLEKEIGPDIIVLDDAFQHRKVKPSYSILLTSYGNLYCDDRYFPSGTLRDSRLEAKRAHLIVVTKCPPNMTGSEQTDIVEKLSPKPHQKVLFSFLEYAPMLEGANGNLPLESFRNRKVTLVTGIADPKPLLAYLTDQGIPFDHLSFKDHHFFTQGELDMLNLKEFVLTTEKDYVRLMGKVGGLYYIGVRHVFMNAGDQYLFEDLKKIRKRCP